MITVEQCGEFAGLASNETVLGAIRPPNTVCSFPAMS